MSRRVHKHRHSNADINDIAEWIAVNSGSIEPAMKWLVSLEEKLEKLADAPGSGTAHPELGADIRSSPFGNYLIFFRKSRGRSITVVRVIHGGRDLSGGLQMD
jgi:plasmid stabilization system protein ParE